MATGTIRRAAPAAARVVKQHGRWFLPISIILILLIWAALTSWTRIPTFLLPSPGQVAQQLAESIADGSLARHFAYTLSEVLLGLLAGSLTATVLGYLLARSRALEKVLSPNLVASQAVPVVAIAPLLMIWFVQGIGSKILVCALTVFFPVLVNTVVGIRAVPENLRDLMRSLHATPGQMLRLLEIPAALPVLLSGLRIGATLSVIGAVVGEFVASDRGLGFLINVARGQYDTALVFVAVFTLIIMALTLYGLVVLAEKRLLKWQARPEV
jgi:NitT/TauT family transport system permease protein